MPTATSDLAPLPPPSVQMFLKSGQLTPQWFVWFESVDSVLRKLRAEVSQAIDDIDALTP